jgi:hypothetical protein
MTDLDILHSKAVRLKSPSLAFITFVNTDFDEIDTLPAASVAHFYFGSTYGNSLRKETKLLMYITKKYSGLLNLCLDMQC